MHCAKYYYKNLARMTNYICMYVHKEQSNKRNRKGKLQLNAFMANVKIRINENVQMLLQIKYRQDVNDVGVEIT